MAIIQVLDQNTINQIAAGEVIERPSAVVKELAENSIDAGASSLTVEVKDGGISFIRITDNGRGIDKEDVRLAFLPHATSKIRTVEDLLHVSSLGFRGEALSSIASVAQVELVTKTSDDFTGCRYTVEGGREGVIEDIGCPEGATFVVRNLFFNTPARKKFLKTASTEAGYITEVVEHLAVSYPDVAVKFILNGQTKLQTPGNGNQKDVIYYLYGREVAANLIEISENYGEMSVSGFIGKPAITRGNRNYENYFLNGRFIRNTTICRAIEDAYKPYMMQHRYPFTSLRICVVPDSVDVNVHPSKLEVRFRNSEALYQLIYHAIGEGLRKSDLIPETKPGNEKKEMKTELNTPKVFEETYKKDEQEKQTLPPPIRQEKSDFRQESLFIQEQEPLIPSLKKQKAEESNAASNGTLIQEEFPYQTTVRPFLSRKAQMECRIIGQIFGTYWLFEYKDHLYMLDQHAAHEKVLFERTMKRLSERKMESQNLLPPIVLTLSVREEEAYQHIKDYLSNLGFEVEHFGGNEYTISAVPVDLFQMAGAQMFTAILDDYVESDLLGTPEAMLERVAGMSCKAAVKGNTILSEREAAALVEELMTLNNPYNCPHGRPTMISMSKQEIEKKFKRIV